MLLLPVLGMAQVKDTLVQASDSLALDSTGIIVDTLALTDTLKFDSTASNPYASINYSKDALDEQVEYSASDSIVYDIVNKKILLYGNASIAYTTLNLKANYIELDWETNEVLAQHTLDSLGRKVGLPEFNDGEQAFTANRMRYNFISRKGIVYEVTSTYNDLYVLGDRAKFISNPNKDTLAPKEYIYSENAIFTTCNHPEPHFGIRSKKQKVVPNEVVIVGPSNLEIMGIPTPIWLPFGFFPITKDRKQGILFPTDYGYQENRGGMGFQGLGYYLPINDYLDLSFRADAYFNGSYLLNLSSTYNKRYKFSGNVNLTFSDIKRENLGIKESQRSFMIRWSHNQASQAHPSNRFSASMNIQTNGFQSRNENDAQSVLQNSLNSNVSFSKNFPDLPISFSANMSHSQNTQTSKVNIELPTIDFRTQTLFPFKQKERAGKEKWFEKISLVYNTAIRNRFEATDTTLFTQQTLEDAKYGWQHRANSSTSFKLSKYISVNPSVSYEEVWYYNSIEKFFNNEIVIDTIRRSNLDSTDFTTVYDTISLGTIEDIRNFGFQRFGDFNASVSMNTQLFGIWKRNKGWLRGFRHTMRPSLSFSYRPDYTRPELGYFDTVEYIDRNGETQVEEYSILQRGIFGAPSNAGLQGNINFSINNNFDAKYFSTKDSTVHKVSLFDNLRMNASYNIAADSFQFSRVNMQGTTRLFNGMTTLNINAQWDPYSINEEGKRIKDFYWDTHKRPLRFEGASARVNTRISVRQIRGLFNRDVRKKQEEEDILETETAEEEALEKQESAKRTVAEADFLSLFENFTINHVFNVNWAIVGALEQRDTFFVQTHTITTSGSIQLTNKWSIRVGNIGYDFQSKRLTYPDLGFARSLHCWDMGMNWQPQRQSYSFFIQVSPSSLGFIKIPWNKGSTSSGRFRSF